ncbi:TetR/AcrR family transcriptional regulator [Zhongshania sp.]|jgi:TetR/AcrR family transcriptional repressor of nem operon|uniref:TetR/AcrR family transcriptional regulator n=1 Tax=Zhongshania sp. TaxID=1971902 RepID=UPI0039E53831
MGITNSKLDTRTQLLDAAQKLVQLRSYEGFNFRDLAEAVGIRKASIYHHFPSKEALTVIMLERTRDRFLAWASINTTAIPLKQLELYCFDLYLERLGAGRQLCPGGTLASAWQHMPEHVQAAARALLFAQQEFVRAAIERGMDNGSIVNTKEAAELAEWLVASVQGALVTSRILASVAESGEVIFTRLCHQTLGVISK